MDEHEQGALPEEEALPKEALEIAEIIAEIEETQALTELEETEEPPKPVKGPGAAAWLAALLVMLFGLVMFVPAMLNGSLATFAFVGLGRELAGDIDGADEAYSRLRREAAEIEEWADENFSFGTSAAPGFTTNGFEFHRIHGINARELGPFEFWRNDELYQPFHMFYQQHRMPRALRLFAARMAAIEDIYMAALDEAADEDDENNELTPVQRQLLALELLRERDPLARQRALYYDTIRLNWMAQDDVTSDELGEHLRALQHARGSERWMYADVAMERARAMEDFALLIQLSEEALRHNPRSLDAMELHVRALYHNGDADGAFEAARYYAQANADNMVYDIMQLIMAELYYRTGRYDESIALAEEVIATARHHPGIYHQATATKGIALMLRGDAQQAFDLMQGYALMTGNENLYFAALAAAIVTDETHFLDIIAPPELREDDWPPPLLDLIAGETTLHEIYTQGWGGLLP